MSILIVSADAEAARSLTSALGRTGQQSFWHESIEDAMRCPPADDPLVLVVDRGMDHFREFINDVSTHTPWVRVYELADSPAAEGGQGRPLIAMPLDAAAV